MLPQLKFNQYNDSDEEDEQSENKLDEDGLHKFYSSNNRSKRQKEENEDDDDDFERDGVSLNLKLLDDDVECFQLPRLE